MKLITELKEKGCFLSEIGNFIKKGFDMENINKSTEQELLVELKSDFYSIYTIYTDCEYKLLFSY